MNTTKHHGKVVSFFYPPHVNQTVQKQQQQQKHQQQTNPTPPTKPTEQHHTPDSEPEPEREPRRGRMQQQYKIGAITENKNTTKVGKATQHDHKQQRDNGGDAGRINERNKAQHTSIFFLFLIHQQERGTTMDFGTRPNYKQNPPTDFFIFFNPTTPANVPTSQPTKSQSQRSQKPRRRRMPWTQRRTKDFWTRRRTQSANANFFYFISFLPSPKQEPRASPTYASAKPAYTNRPHQNINDTDRHSTQHATQRLCQATKYSRPTSSSEIGFFYTCPTTALISKGGQPSATSKGGPETDQKETTNSKFQRADAHLKGCVETGEPGSPVTTLTAYYARTKCAYALVRSMQYALIS